MDNRLAAVDAIDTDKQVDLEVSEVEVDVDRVETSDKIDEGLSLDRRNGVQERCRNAVARGEGLTDGNGERGHFGVVAALVREVDVVAFTGGGDADVVFG
jgi:hypothetical protein